MKISEQTISALGQIVTGDEGISPYRSGPVLVRLFNSLGFDDVYGQGFPSRWSYAEERIREINDTDKIVELLNIILDSREYIASELSVEDVVAFLNRYLKYDGFEIARYGELYKIRDLKGSLVKVNNLDVLAGDYMMAQIDKCDRKILEGDYDGAITNARTLLEAILIEIEYRSCEDRMEYEGDLPKLYKRVIKVLELEPSRSDIAQPLKQLLGGLFSIIYGLSSLRNKMSDAHASTYETKEDYAKLAVNAAKTLADFLISAYEGQITMQFEQLE